MRPIYISSPSCNCQCPTASSIYARYLPCTVNSRVTRVPANRLSWYYPLGTRKNTGVCRVPGYPLGDWVPKAALVFTLQLFDPVTLTFNFLTTNEKGDRDLSCAIQLPSLVMIRPVVFVLECTHIHTEVRYRAVKCHIHAGDYIAMSKTVVTCKISVGGLSLSTRHRSGTSASPVSGRSHLHSPSDTDTARR